MRSACRGAVLAGLVALGALLATSSAGGQEVDGPTLAVSPGSVAAGDDMVVTISGFRAANVTVSVCGNAAARGSVDCDLVGSEGIALRNAVTTRGLQVHAPPVPCPCVVRAASRTQDEVAIATLDLLGHPVAEVVRSDASSLLDVIVDVRRASGGAWPRLRSSLGGPTSYALDVTVRNRSGLELDGVALSATATRGGDQVAGVELPAIRTLAPGGRWEHRAELQVPAPVVGDLRFEVVATGAGRAVAASGDERAVPVLLLLLVSVLVVDVGLLVRLRITRWRLRRTATEVPSALAVPA